MLAKPKPRKNPTHLSHLAQSTMKRNLAHHNDWIVLNTTMEILAKWADKDAELKEWLKPHLERHTKDKRKSVANRARKFLGEIT